MRTRVVRALLVVLLVAITVSTVAAAAPVPFLTAEVLELPSRVIRKPILERPRHRPRPAWLELIRRLAERTWLVR